MYNLCYNLRKISAIQFLHPQAMPNKFLEIFSGNLPVLIKNGVNKLFRSNGEQQARIQTRLERVVYLQRCGYR